MKKLIFLLFPFLMLAQNPTNFPYGIKNPAATSDSAPAYFTTSQVDGVHKKTPAANVEKTANKSDSYTTSSSTTYASTKAVVDGLATKISGTGTINTIPKFTASGVLGNSIIYDNGSSIGIGTITPSGKLHVSGFSNTTDVGQLILSEIDNPTRKLTIGVNNAANWGFLQMLVSGDNYYPFYMNPNGGNVGIGTTTDNGLDKLQVNGSISATNYTGSATLTGTPTAPTATAGTNTTQIATTAFVQAANAGNVKTTGDQTIAGLKEFTDGININSTVNELFQINKSGVKYAHMIVDNVSDIKGFGLFGSYLALENTSLNIDPQLRIANSPANAFATIQAYSSTNPLTKHSLYLLASGEVYVRANNNDRVTLEGGSFYFKTGNLLVNTNIDNGVDKLQVNGSALLGNATRIGNSSDGFIRLGGGTLESLNAASTDYSKITFLASEYDFTFSGASKMYLKPSGNLLIGTTTDNGVDKLQVKGDIRFGESNVGTLGTPVFRRLKAYNWNNEFQGSINIEDVSTNSNHTLFSVTLRNSASVLYEPITINGNTGNVLIGTTIDNGVDKLQVNGSISATSYTGSATLTGTPTAPTATVGTNTTQIATTAFVQANARPYKVYTALLSQSGTSAPTATVLENTLGGTVVWTRNTTGQYFGTLSTAFVSDKTFCLTGGNTNNENIHSTTQRNNDNEIVVQSYSSGAKTDGVLNKTAIEIRVYN